MEVRALESLSQLLSILKSSIHQMSLSQLLSILKSRIHQMSLSQLLSILKSSIHQMSLSQLLSILNSSIHQMQTACTHAILPPNNGIYQINLYNKSCTIYFECGNVNWEEDFWFCLTALNLQNWFLNFMPSFTTYKKIRKSILKLRNQL
jgi:hypothetical protein